MKHKAYVINLDFRPDRWERINEMWSKYFELERFPAIHVPKDGHLGDKLSHVKVARLALETSDTAIVLEDDAVPTRWFELIGMRCIEDAIKHVDKWDYINLGPTLDFKKPDGSGPIAELDRCASEWFLHSNLSHSTQSVLYNKQSLQLLEKSLHTDIAVDLYLGKKASSQWVPIRLLSYQPNEYSNIEAAKNVCVPWFSGAINLLKKTIPDDKLPNELLNLLNGQFDFASELFPVENACVESEKYITTIPSYPKTYSGRGIVTCGGGIKYFDCVQVCIKELRRLGCNLPIQLWHLGPEEITEHMKSLLKPLGVECVDAFEVREKYPTRILNDTELTVYSIVHSPYKEVFFLGAEYLPLIDPGIFFDTVQFKETGAIFWADHERLGSNPSIWSKFGIPYRDEPEFEPGQAVVNKERCWKALCLTMWYNEHYDLFYNHAPGEKETFRFAFLKLNQQYSIFGSSVDELTDTTCLHDFEGRRIFRCHKPEKMRKATKQIINTVFDYWRVGYDHRPMIFLKLGAIGEGNAGCEMLWELKYDTDGKLVLEISSHDKITCRLTEDVDKVWRGCWIDYEKMPIELAPVGPISQI